MKIQVKINRCLNHFTPKKGSTISISRDKTPSMEAFLVRQEVALTSQRVHLTIKK